jgi:hypothetical protein
LTIPQLFFAIVGVIGAQTTFLVFYINAKIDGKIDPLSKQVDMLVQYMILHEGKIATLEERIKGK